MTCTYLQALWNELKLLSVSLAELRFEPTHYQITIHKLCPLMKPRTQIIVQSKAKDHATLTSGKAHMSSRRVVQKGKRPHSLFLQNNHSTALHIQQTVWIMINMAICCIYSCTCVLLSSFLGAYRCRRCSTSF